MDTFQEVIAQTKEVIQRFEKIEGKPWGIEAAMIELSKQVGQLSALIMMQEHYYANDRDTDQPQYKVSQEKIADELSDILLIIIRIADIYKIDLEAAHTEALEVAKKYLVSKGV